MLLLLWNFARMYCVGPEYREASNVELEEMTDTSKLA